MCFCTSRSDPSRGMQIQSFERREKGSGRVERKDMGERAKGKGHGRVGEGRRIKENGWKEKELGEWVKVEQCVCEWVKGN